MGIYLDNNATTRVDDAVVAEMLPLFTEHFGNPSSMHGYGAAVGGKIEWARGEVQKLLGAAFDTEIVFTSGGTESDNTAILSALKAYPKRREIVTSVVEHPAVLSFCDYLESKEGYKVHRIPVDGKGDLDMAAYEAALSENVAIVSIMWANNETGTIFPVEQLAVMAKKVGALFHTDAVQAVGKIPMDLANSEIDMLSLSGHKLHAPKGVGALYLKRGIRFRPLFRGGHQERGRRAGTENAPAIVGLGKSRAGRCQKPSRCGEGQGCPTRSSHESLPCRSTAAGDCQGAAPNTSCGPTCLAAERYRDQARWAVETYAWRFDGLERAPRAGGAA